MMRPEFLRVFLQVFRGCVPVLPACDCDLFRTGRRGPRRDEWGGSGVDRFWLSPWAVFGLRGADGFFFGFLWAAAIAAIVAEAVSVSMAVSHKRKNLEAYGGPVRVGPGLELAWTLVPALLLVVLGLGSVHI